MGTYYHSIIYPFLKIQSITQSETESLRSNTSHVTREDVLFYNVQLKEELMNFRITQHHELLQIGDLDTQKIAQTSQTVCIFVGLAKVVGSIKWSLVESHITTYVESITSQREGKCYKISYILARRVDKSEQSFVNK